jgi:uncharacterized protein (TIGR03382 family)
LMGGWQRTIALVAALGVMVALLVWLVRRRRARGVAR